MLRKIITLFSTISLLLAPEFLLANQGVTSTSVTVGVTTPLSGPAAMWGVNLSAGMQAWATHLNEQGGIHGRQIKLIIKDDGYNPARALANLQQMKDQVFAVVGQLGSAPCNAAKDFFPENKIPLITPYGNVGIWGNQPKSKRRYYFVSYPDYEDESDFLTEFAMNALGVKKIAHFYQNDEYGLGANAGIKKAIKNNPGRLELVAEVPYEVGERALGTHALKLKESGAELVMLTAMMSSAANMSKQMAKIAYQPKVMGNFPLGDKIMFKIAGKTWEGTFVNLSAHMGIPGIHEEASNVAEILVKRKPKLKGKEFLGLFGAVSIMHLAKGMENAGPNLTTESLISGMEQIKDWVSPAGGAPVTYSPDQHHGNNSVWPAVARNGVHVPIGNYIKFKPRF